MIAAERVDVFCGGNKNNKSLKNLSKGRKERKL